MSVAPLATDERAPLGRSLFVIAALYTVFVVYGSLVPLEFEPMPLGAALRRFRDIPFLDLDVHRRADWVANALLFIPLSSLWLGALTARWPGPRAAWICALAVLAAGLGLGAAIEFVQIFFPQRTVSQNDLWAQSIGAVIGLAAWPALRPLALTVLRSVRAPAHDHRKSRLVLGVYVAALLVYNVMPLDLTISIAELHEKWKNGRVLLDPFRLGGGPPAEVVYELVTDVVLWMPVAALAMLESGNRLLRSVAIVVGIAAALELAQLLVFSRVTDVRDVFTAALGALAGCAVVRLGGGFRGGEDRAEGRGVPAVDARGARGTRTMLLVVVATAWFALTLALLWYPYEFTSDPAVVKARWARLFDAPLTTYYFGSEYRALTEMLRRIVVFLPAGVLVALAGGSWPLALALGAGSAAVVELGQVLLPGKAVDSGDLLFAMIAAALGHQAVEQLRRGTRPFDGKGPRTVSQHPRRRFGRAALVAAAYAVIVLAGALAAEGLSRWTALPYNARELIAGDAPALGGALVLCAVTALVAPGPLLARQLARSGTARGVVTLALAAPLQGTVAWAFLAGSVPEEALHDIVGSPVLGWPWHFESLARFVALQLPVAIGACGAGCAVLAGGRASDRTLALSRWLVVAAPLLLVAHLVVVDAAATDNLTELMRAGGGPIASGSLFGWILLTFGAGYLAAAALAALRVSGIVAAVAVAAAAIGVGWALLGVGLAPSIEKYGATFAALEFLLSPSREALVSGAALARRYVWFHATVIAIITVLALPAYVALRAAARPGPARETGRPSAERGFLSELDGAYVVLQLSDEERTFLRAEASRPGFTPAGYLAGAVEELVRAPAVADVSDAAIRPSGCQHAVDVWVDRERLQRLCALAQAATTGVETLVLASLRRRLARRGSDVT